MPIDYICPICQQWFTSQHTARDHIKEKHPRLVEEYVAGLTPKKLQGLTKRNIDPQNWAAGYLLRAPPVAPLTMPELDTECEDLLDAILCMDIAMCGLMEDEGGDSTVLRTLRHYEKLLIKHGGIEEEFQKFLGR